MRRILIVDDALDLGRMLRTALETLNLGLDVRVVPSAEEALLELTRQPAALMVTDIRLPGMSGFELLKKVRQRSPDTRFIMITGMSDNKLVHDAEAAGADRFMHKPIQVSEFLQVARDLLSQPAVAVQMEQPAGLGNKMPAANLPAENLVGILTRLRKELGAQLVLMADDHGHVVAQAGELANFDFENRWSPAVMAVLSAAAKVARIVHPGLPQAALAFRGEPYNLTLAPVGEYALAIYHAADQSGLRIAIAQEVVFEAQKDLASILEALDVKFFPMAEVNKEAITVETAEPEPFKSVSEQAPSGEEPRLEELAEMLRKKTAPLPAEQVEDFWEQALNGETPTPAEPDVLTYDQAQQLGLTPDNE